MSKSTIFAAAIAALLVSGSAWAVPIVGSAGGYFSNLSSCDNSGSNQDCRIVSSSNGSNTRVEWGSTSSSTNFRDPSTLTSVDVSFNTNTDALGLIIGRLDWFNSATLANETDDNFWVKWNYSITFSQPTGSADPNGSETFNLNILNPTNPTGDSIKGLTLAGLNPGLTLSLNGVTISNFRYEAVDGSGSCSGIETSYSNATWFNCENNWATLYIKADFRATAPPPAQSVPEPGTLALFGLALAGLGFAGRRRK